MCKTAVWSGKWLVDGREYARVVEKEHGCSLLLECGNYHTIKLLEHGMKVVECVFEKRLRKMVEIKEQYGFVQGKGNIDVIFILRQLQEKYLENDKELYLVFVDLEKV